MTERNERMSQTDELTKRIEQMKRNFRVTDELRNETFLLSEDSGLWRMYEDGEWMNIKLDCNPVHIFSDYKGYKVEQI